ncbi:helix-turn-helix domain-containing protein [Myroides marinus]|nr:helix-turn-helix domain-containing protein [Myroides marinus]MDM1363314.1 helix-turn-helix transcriptional regulator [Myroides marinus]MDM1370356.1 helix-turn-helix transcriptional regulator [Myroides marinus]MDM1373849.1 helix-turn-helix transcriptional regulator [Myroides marinus]MDM1377336.1 helix-turn-helix transcriptional regulator [Myroides marinus]MDM1384630.1 helix-turn-helix transcriptional regulator [Myroides marinus]
MISKKDSDLYKSKLGQILKTKREEMGYTIEDIVFMTSISRSSIIKVEKGETNNIDFFVEYSKSVNYGLEPLDSFGIALVPTNQISEERQVVLRLTQRIRILIKEGFLDNGKDVLSIRLELSRIDSIYEHLNSVKVSGVLRNLFIEGVVSIEKKGRKNLYKKR